MLQIIKDRIRGHSWRHSDIWNSAPGALGLDLDYTDDIMRVPFYHDNYQLNISTTAIDNHSYLLPNFTAVIYVDSEYTGVKTPISSNYANAPLFLLTHF